MKAFIENGNIFIQDILIPKDAITIDVPNWTTINDLIIDNGTLRLKTEAEKEQDRILQEAEEAKQKLAETDADMIRVIEDVIDVLIAKKIIDFKDLPEVVQEKLNERKSSREKIK